MATVKENLIAAKALIDAPEKWIKGNLQNASGDCFCAYGAVAAHRRKAHLDYLEEDKALAALTDALPAGFLVDRKGILPLAQFNDAPDTAHADIMALFDRAIAAADDGP